MSQCHGGLGRANANGSKEDSMMGKYESTSTTHPHTYRGGGGHGGYLCRNDAGR